MLVYYPKALPSPTQGFASSHFICMIGESKVVSCQRTPYKLQVQYSGIEKQTNKQMNLHKPLCNGRDFSSPYLSQVHAIYSDLLKPSCNGHLELYNGLLILTKVGYHHGDLSSV